MEEKCVCSVQIWKEVFDHFDRQPKKIEINENYSIDDDAKETLQEKSKRMLVTEASQREMYLSEVTCLSKLKWKYG